MALHDRGPPVLLGLDAPNQGVDQGSGRDQSNTEECGDGVWQDKDKQFGKWMIAQKRTVAYAPPQTGARAPWEDDLEEEEEHPNITLARRNAALRRPTSRMMNWTVPQAR